MRTGIQKRVWLHIYHEGGTWTPDGIAERFEIGRQRANVILQNMVTRTGALERCRTASRRTAFAITDACKVPSDVTVSELREAGLPMPPNSVFQLAQGT